MMLTGRKTGGMLPGMMTPAQCRAARALLDWSQADLAARSGVGCSTIRSFEHGRHTLIRSNMAMLRATLETAGVVFIEAEEIGPGVLLRTGRATG